MTDEHHKAPSYRPCELCSPPRGCDYNHLSALDRPCWGEVTISEDFGPEGNIHACEGHQDVWGGIDYRPEPPTSDTARADR
jgi:hypothetical protein